MKKVASSRKTLNADLTAGLTTVLVTIPDGLASAILAGVHERIKAQLDYTKTTETIAEEDIFLETEALRKSTQTALKAAEQWLEAKKG